MNIIRRHIDNMNLLLTCILLLSHSLIFFRFHFYQYMVIFLSNTVIYVFLLLCLCILIVRLCIFIVPAGTHRLPWRRFFRAFSSVVRQMPGYNSQRRGTAPTLPKFLCCPMYCLFCVVLCIVCVYMCTVLLPPGDNPTAINIYIYIYIYIIHKLKEKSSILKYAAAHSLGIAVFAYLTTLAVP